MAKCKNCGLEVKNNHPVLIKCNKCSKEYCESCGQGVFCDCPACGSSDNDYMQSPGA